MIETPNTSIDVDLLMEEIRAEVARANRIGPSYHGFPAPGATSAAAGERDVQWTAVEDGLGAAERHASVGVRPPDFHRLPRVLRGPARLVARGVLFLAEVVTHYQRTFNHELVAVSRRHVARTQELEREVAALRAELEDLRVHAPAREGDAAESSQNARVRGGTSG